MLVLIFKMGNVFCFFGFFWWVIELRVQCEVLLGGNQRFSSCAARAWKEALPGSCSLMTAARMSCRLRQS